MDPIADTLVNVPPSGHMAGIWARNDASRGVHKAPANETVRGALNLSYRLTRDEQGVLNDVGVNCIRLFAREGIRVWGARTLADAASEWRYLNVRRLFNMIEESIAEGTTLDRLRAQRPDALEARSPRHRRVPDPRLA